MKFKLKDAYRRGLGQKRLLKDDIAPPSRGGVEEKLTQNEELLHDKAHIQEHLEEVIDQPDLSKLSDEELEFYYFQLHDTDNNSKLDGLEILQAILHTTHSNNYHEDDSETVDNEIESVKDENDDLDYYIELIDRVLAEDDKDQDGYLNYPEFVAGGRKTNIQPSVKMIK
ncbi:EF-hand domain pair [Popillia japonica]|uniref:EF-hand domain pair n=1 Tax=Popillia japonica TaxID=7064 RepID=A0AAW1KH32_POPJA